MDIGKVFATIGHFFKHAEVFVSDLFVKLFGKDAAHTLAVAAESLLHSELGKIAWTAVQEVEKTVVGAEKRSVAFGKILASASAAGIETKTSLINMLIEICVQRLQSAFGPAPTTP